MWKFEVYAGSSAQFNGRLLADNGANVAGSGEAFASKSNAERAASGFKANAAGSAYEVYETSAGNWQRRDDRRQRREPRQQAERRSCRRNVKRQREQGRQALIAKSIDRKSIT